MCEDCDTWYHASCQNISDSKYDQLCSSIAWICSVCNGPNYSSTLFDLHGVASETRARESEDTSFSSIPSLDSTNPASPRFTSSPKKTPPRPQIKNRPLRILNVNCQSISNKKERLLNLIDSTRPDIIIATETWLNDSIQSSEYFSSKYEVHRRDRRENKQGGGVIIAVNSDYTNSREEDLESPTSETLWIKISAQNCKSVYIGACYRPKQNDHQTIDDVNHALEKICGRQNNITVLGGDFNLPGWDWKQKKLKPNTTYPAIHQHFADILDDNGLIQIIEEPTRQDNTLDLIATNRPNQINRKEVIPGISDHQAVFVELEVQPCRRKQAPRDVPLYSKANWEQLKTHATLIADNIKAAQPNSSVDQLWDLFKTKLLEGVKRYIPHRRTKAKDSCSWITREIRQKIKRRDKAFKMCKKTGKASAETKFRRLKKEIQRELRQAYWKHIEDIVTPVSSDQPMFTGMKKFWKFIKQQRTDFSGVSQLKVKGNLISDPIAKAEALNDQFQSVFTRETDPSHIQPPETMSPDMPEINITVPGVLKLLQQLNPNKAPGPDSISSLVLKELANELAAPLAVIFNKSLETGKVPTDWKLANVVPAYKKGQKYECSNYRPISLTCIASKVMEHIITSSIMKHAKSHDILYSLQHGFREARSCETQLLEFVHDVSESMQRKLQTDVCVLDFSKAFDKVGHMRLLQKLNWYGIRGKTNEWIKDFLNNRQQAVVVDGFTSTNRSVLSGVPQGSVLGPCLFLFYINDIAQGLNSTTRLFADDTMIYMTIKNEDDARLLQQDLNTLAQWESKWMMEFHPGKCEVINISRNKRPISHKYTLHGQELKNVDVIKYLGVNISKDLRWDNHINAMTNKANRSLNFLRRNIKINNNKIKSQAYTSLVRPILEYSQTVWDPHTATAAKKIEAVQRRAARFVTNRYRRTSSATEMLDSLEWQPLSQRRRLARLTMFYKIHNGLVASPLPLESKQLEVPTRKENSQAYRIPPSRSDYHRLSFFPRTVRDWNILPETIVRKPTPEAFRNALLSASPQQ